MKNLPKLLLLTISLFITFGFTNPQTRPRRVQPSEVTEIPTLAPTPHEYKVNRPPITPHSQAITHKRRSAIKQRTASAQQSSIKKRQNTRRAKKTGTYINVNGERVRRPTFSKSAPSGATARCRDGSYSFSRNRRGTCSHHGGVARWL